MQITQACALCLVKYEPKELSHIIPKFVYRWLKRSSATQYLRFGQKINQRVQDGVKEHFLCEACEDCFGKDESTFASQIFSPFVVDNNYVKEHDEYLLRFGVSVSWRVLAYFEKKSQLKHFRGRHTMALSDTLAAWRKYLLGDAIDISPHLIQLLPLSEVVGEVSANTPESINRYLRRAVEMDVVVSDDEAFTYCKLGPILFVGIITCPDTAVWRSTTVFKEGYFTGRDFAIPQQCKDFIFMRSRRLAEIESKISNQQRQKIQASCEKDAERAKCSDTFKSTLMDLNIHRRTDLK